MKVHEPSIDLTGCLPVRLSDKWGEGWYGAPRGGRTHKGVDYSAYPRTTILAITHGVVTKLGYAYSDDLSFRYIQVTQYNAVMDPSRGYQTKYDYRYFYVQPKTQLVVGKSVHTGEILGTVQNLTERYPGIINHMHLSIKKDGVHIDPTQFLRDRRNY